MEVAGALKRERENSDQWYARKSRFVEKFDGDDEEIWMMNDNNNDNNNDKIDDEELDCDDLYSINKYCTDETGLESLLYASMNWKGTNIITNQDNQNDHHHDAMDSDSKDSIDMSVTVRTLEGKIRRYYIESAFVSVRKLKLLMEEVTTRSSLYKSMTFKHCFFQVDHFDISQIKLFSEKKFLDDDSEVIAGSRLFMVSQSR